jgi:hypothetical protein
MLDMASNQATTTSRHFKFSINQSSCYFRLQCPNLGTLLVVQLVEALRYKPEGRGFDTRWCHWNF